MHPCKLKTHLETAHRDKKEQPLDFFKRLHDEFHRRMTEDQMFTQKAVRVSKKMLAAYKIAANLNSKASKLHTIGESLIVAVVLSAVMDQNPQEVTSVIPQSNSLAS